MARKCPQHKRAFYIVFVRCNRCGRRLASGSRSLWGAGEEGPRHLYGQVCTSCLTPAEVQDMQARLAAHMAAIAIHIKMS
jgi:hypothetical protein